MISGHEAVVSWVATAGALTLLPAGDRLLRSRVGSNGCKGVDAVVHASGHCCRRLGWRGVLRRCWTDGESAPVAAVWPVPRPSLHCGAGCPGLAAKLADMGSRRTIRGALAGAGWRCRGVRSAGDGARACAVWRRSLRRGRGFCGPGPRRSRRPAPGAGWSRCARGRTRRGKTARPCAWPRTDDTVAPCRACRPGPWWLPPCPCSPDPAWRPRPDGTVT